MRTVVLSEDGPETTALGFGCAHLLNVGASQRQRLLETAFDAGIRHFDVAPIYGLGAAERELGKFAAGRRDDVVLATKFGVEPGRTSSLLGAVQAPARRALRAVPRLRRFARSHAAALYTPPSYDRAAARRSLERSLAALRTDYVDLFLLHDPRPGDVPAEELRAYLDQERASGRIRAWGVAAELEAAVSVAHELGAPVPVLQTHDDVLAPSEVPAVADARITYGAIAGALMPVVDHVAADPDRRRRWSDAVGCDCADPAAVAPLLLRYALAANPSGVVLFSTTKPERIHRAAGAVEEDGAARAGLEAFVRLVDAELRPRRPAAART